MLFFSTNFIIYFCYYYDGDNNMKKIFKGIFAPLILSVLCGFVCGKFVYGIYKDDIGNKFNSSLVYLLEGKTYLTYDGMRSENRDGNYVNYVDDFGYKTLFGITKNIDNVEKIKSLYDRDLDVLEYYVSNEKISNKQDEYDVMLNDSVGEDNIRVVVNDILNMYKEDDTVRLVLID